MEEKFIHFLSYESCILSINGENAGIIDNKGNLEIDIIAKNKNLYVGYSPICLRENIPYNFLLSVENTISCDNEYIEVVPFPNNQFDIIMKPFYYYQINNSNLLLNTMIGKFFISIISDNTTNITIYEGNTVVFNTHIIKLKTARCEIKKSLLIIEGVIEDNKYYLLIIDTSNFEIIYNDISHSIEKNSDSVISYKKLHNIINHAQVFTYNFENNSKDIYYVYENNTPHYPKHNLLIPYAFLESIKLNDDNFAKEFLDPSHINTPIQKFRDYFGNIQNIYLNRHSIIDDKINYTILSNNKYKNYNFIMENEKIKDIEEIF